MNESPLVNICIVTFNRSEYTKQCIQSLLDVTDYDNYVINVVDNASSDDTLKVLERLSGHHRIRRCVALEQNLGLAKASNIAILLEPDAEYCFKMDNDLVVKHSDWLHNIVRIAEKCPHAGALSYNVEPYSYPRSLGCRYGLRRKHGNVGGGNILLPRRVWKRFGGWSEDYGAYGEEDADLGFRLTLDGMRFYYMEDQYAFYHLPSGRAAVIERGTFMAHDDGELTEQREYRLWKDEQRRLAVVQLHRNKKDYLRGRKNISRIPFAALSYFKIHYDSDLASLFDSRINARPFLYYLRYCVDFIHRVFQKFWKKPISPSGSGS